jgi:hypothetical protein
VDIVGGPPKSRADYVALLLLFFFGTIFGIKILSKNAERQGDYLFFGWLIF